MIRILILDNRDSFSHNLRHLFKASNKCTIDVVPTDDYQINLLDQYDALVLSPGPGLPDEHSQLKRAIKHAIDRLPIWGVCLGHQAIAEVFGGCLLQLEEVYHGIRTEVKIVDREGLWKGINETEPVGRYHSYVVDANQVPESLKVTSVDEHGHIMSFQHHELPIYGVQFHPESYMTNQGHSLMMNFLEVVEGYSRPITMSCQQESLHPGKF